MKKIGFIDLRLKSSAFLGDASGRAGIQEVINDASVYLFRENSHGYVLDKTVNLSSLSRADEIDRFCLSIPAELLNFRIVSLPFSDIEKLRKVLPFELDNLLLGGSDSVVFEPIVRGRKEDIFEVLVVCIEKRHLTSILAFLAERGVDPYVITSTELNALFKKGLSDFTEQLIESSDMSLDDRIQSAKEEILTPTINLRTGEFAYTRDFAMLWKGLRLTAILVAVLAFVLNMSIAVKTTLAKKETASIKSEMRREYTTLFPNEKKVTDELYQLKSHMKEVQEKADALIGVSPLQVMLALSQQKFQNAVFNEISLDRDRITLKGEAFSMGAIEKMRSGLGEFLTDISLSDARPITENKILFSVTARYKNL